MLAIDTIKSHQGVSLFIQKVLDQVYTEEDGREIRDELTDHIFSLASDYIEAGHSEDTAIKKALLQMGDPSEIGYSFTDYDGMKRRQYLRVGLKWLACLLILLTMVITIELSGGFASLFSDSSSSSSDTSPWFLLYQLVSLPFYLCLSITQGRFHLNGMPLGRLKISKEPILILWACKKRLPWEYIAVGVFFLPMFLMFLFLMAYEGDNPLYVIAFLAVISFSIWLIFYSEKYRIPKYLVLEEGIVIKNRLISWAAIDRISWTKDYMSSNRSHHKLIIEHLCRVPDQRRMNSGLSVKRVIDVNHNQYFQLKAIIGERV